MMLSIILAVCVLPVEFNAAISAPPSVDALPSTPIDLSKTFEGYEASFVLVNEKTQTVERFNSKRCKERLGPCSTFKVPHALIALELGVLSDENHLMKWDGKKRWRDALNRDHTLASAMSDSVLWYFQRVAPEVGEERMRANLKKLGYGNQDISSGLATFWLNQSLKISADEQVEFLRKLRTDRLPYGKHALNTTRKVITLESANGYTLAGKTGTAASDDHERMILGWFVGYVERGDEAYVFACNIVADDNASGPHAKKLVFKILRERGILPAETKMYVPNAASDEKK